MYIIETISIKFSRYIFEPPRGFVQYAFRWYVQGSIKRNKKHVLNITLGVGSKPTDAYICYVFCFNLL